jgi:hypothetical protein
LIWQRREEDIMVKVQIFDIRRNETGEHEVIQANPLVLGTFEDYDNARLFLDVLMKAPAPSETGPAPVKPAATPKPEKPTAAKPAEPANVPESSPKPFPAPKTLASGTMPVDLVPDEDVWREVLDRLAAGEKINTVAVEIGVTFGELLSKWVEALRAGTHQEPGADNPVSGGVEGVLKRGKPVKRSPEAHERGVAKLMGEE